MLGYLYIIPVDLQPFNKGYFNGSGPDITLCTYYM